MGKYKVAVYAICKNEAKFVDKWLDSMEEADEIYVTDTGSEDNTVELLKKRGVHVQTVILDKWRFDTARNISLDFVPEDVDICVCTDLDEVLDKGWRKLLEDAWTEDTTRLKYMYTWSFNTDGSPGTSFWYEKIHHRKGFKWIHPVHEILKYYGDKPDKYAIEGRIHLKHYPDPEKSRGQYLGLLELSVKENPDDDRNVHYLGREYMFYGKWKEAIEVLKRHIKMPNALWKDEKAASMRYIARSYKALGNMQKAEIWLYRAIAEAPHLREGYIELAQLVYSMKKWHLAYAMVCEALEIKEKPDTYINEGFCWDYTPYDLAAIAAYNMGMYEESLRLAEKAYSLSASDKRLRDNVDIIAKKVNE